MDKQKKLGHNQILFKCEICDKEFENKNTLKKHFNNVHNLEKKHKCNICQRVFPIKSQMTSHMKIVHGNKKLHKCDSCEKSFS